MALADWGESAAKAEVARLVGEYTQAKSEGRLSRYGDNRFGEESTKKDFILPLFRALGWNVEDSREVSAEQRVLHGRADYAFKIGGVTKFLVEAKTLSKNLMEREHLQQVIDYSYAKGVPWAVLTNFAQTAVLYSEIKDSNPFNCRFIELSASEYVSAFDRLRLLSRTAIANNELDSKAEQFGRRPRKQPIDKQLLKDLNSFRLDLAKDLGRLNADLFRGSDEALEETVQRILDRLIFIRVAEDRGLEDRQLKLLSQEYGTNVSKRIRELFRRYDENFDSKLFQQHAADEVRMDGSVLQRVLRGLHQTEDESIRYDFGAIDADVLGVMYEQYLGLILRQTAKRAKLADGKVNRKEQGIYYTPTWVADYIVKFAVEQALERKGAKADELRVLDPACGSGTFLLRAFDHLMQARNPTGRSVQSRFDSENAGPLLALRSSVLTDNLFGVDLDARAVEIAQLNLMIRAAESRHRLPTLERNVRVGNSVISDPSVDYRALDWGKAFPGPMDDGGFDVIVTNPPYVRIQNLEESQAQYLANRYKAEWNFDLYTTFVQQSWELLRSGGVAGFILPNKFLNSKYGESLRGYLGSRGAVLRLFDFRAYQVFEDATTYTCMLFLRKGKVQKSFTYGSLRAVSDPGAERSVSEGCFEVSDARIPADPSSPWSLVPGSGKLLFDRLGQYPRKLKDLCKSIFVGLQTSADSIYIVPVTKEGKVSLIVDHATGESVPIESELLHPILRGREIHRWGVAWQHLCLIYPYRRKGSEIVPILAAELRTRFPNATAYFQRHESKLKGRDGAPELGEDWHLFAYRKNLDKFDQPKILTQVLANRGRFSLDLEGRFYFVGGGGSGGYGIQLNDESEENLFYTLGVLNSRPLEFYHHLISTPFRGGFFAYSRQYLEPLPIPMGTADQRAQIAHLAKELTETTSRLRRLVESTDEHRAISNQLFELEQALDRLTLDLFEVSDEESSLLPRLPST